MSFRDFKKKLLADVIGYAKKQDAKEYFIFTGTKTDMISMGYNDSIDDVRGFKTFRIMLSPATSEILEDMVNSDSYGEKEFIDGVKHEVVSLFDLGVTAYDISSLSNSKIEEMLNSDDIEEYAEKNNIDEIEIVEIPDGQYGTDLCPLEGQSEVKCIVDDVSLREVFEGGVAEYLSDFDETFYGIEYVDGGNVRFITQNEENGEYIDD